MLRPVRGAAFRVWRKDGKIFIMGYSYYTGEEYEQECDVESGMDILNFILSQKSFECYE